MAAMIVVALGYVFTLPLRADLAIRDGNLALQAQDGPAALAAYARAAEIAPWDPRPAFYQGRLLNAAGDSERAFPFLADAAGAEPGDAAYALAAAVEALELEPGNAAVLARLDQLTPAP